MKETKVVLYLKIVLNIILLIAAGLFLLFVFPRLLSFFMPIVIGWIISLIANPLVRLLEKRVKLVRKHGSVIIIVIVILAIVGILAYAGTLLFREAKELIDELPVLVEEAGQKFDQFTAYLQNKTETLPAGIRNSINSFILGISSYVNNISQGSKPITVGKVSLFAKNVAEAFLYIIITILSAYFFTAYRDELSSGLKKHIPASIVNYWRLVCDNFKSAFGGYFKAQFKIMLILIVIMFAGFEILQVGYSFLFALGIAFLDFLPVFGTGTILWPWALIEMIDGNYFKAVGLILIYLICQVVKQILQPKMVGDSIGLHPLATLILLFVGYKLYGVVGMIIGIPIGMVLLNFYRIGMFDRIIKGIQIIAHDINDFRKF